MAEFKAGDPVLVIEYDTETGERGRSLPATVEQAGRAYVQARLEDGRLWSFHQGGGWAATPELAAWRLVPDHRELAVPDVIEGVVSGRDRIRAELRNAGFDVISAAGERAAEEESERWTDEFIAASRKEDGR